MKHIVRGISVKYLAILFQNYDFCNAKIPEKNHFLEEKKDQGLVAGGEGGG